MFTVEFHASEGGADSALFAEELADSVSKFAGLTVSQEGRVVTAKAFHRL